MDTTQPTSYADMSRQHREEKKFRMPNGKYTALYKGHFWEVGKDAPHNPIIRMEFKPLTAPTPETLKKLNDKNRMLVKRFVFSPKTPFQLGDFINFMEDLGVDLSTVRPRTEDPDFKDLRQYLDQADRTPFEVEVETKQQKEKEQYYDIYFRKVQKIFNVAPATGASETPPPPASGPTYDQMIAAGWTDDHMKADPLYAHLVPVAATPPPAPTPPPPPAPAAGAPPAPPANPMG